MFYFLACFLTYASISGIKDAIMYSHKTDAPFGWNEHKLWVAERGTFIAVFIGMALFRIDFIQILNLIIGSALCFSFIHNGYYYETRKSLGVKHYHWFYKSKQSTARFNIGGKTRALMFIGGILYMAFNVTEIILNFLF